MTQRINWLCMLYELKTKHIKKERFILLCELMMFPDDIIREIVEYEETGLSTVEQQLLKEIKMVCETTEGMPTDDVRLVYMTAHQMHIDSLMSVVNNSSLDDLKERSCIMSYHDGDLSEESKNELFAKAKTWPLNHPVFCECGI